jgi:hypothetical protein
MSEAQLLLGLFLWARRVSPDEGMEVRTDTRSEAQVASMLGGRPGAVGENGRARIAWADLG